MSSWQPSGWDLLTYCVSAVVFELCSTLGPTPFSSSSSWQLSLGCQKLRLFPLVVLVFVYSVNRPKGRLVFDSGFAYIYMQSQFRVFGTNLQLQPTISPQRVNRFF